MSLIGANQLLAITAGSAAPPPGPGEDSLYTWGTNTAGQLGQGVNVTVVKASPTLVSSSWSQVSVGNSHTMAIKTDGTLWAWGYNASGQVGDGTTVDKPYPVQIGSATNWSKVDTGNLFSMALNTSGALYTWGDNAFLGNLGDGTAISKSSPVQVNGTWIDMAAGNQVAFGVKSDNTLWGWGYGLYGTLGLGTTLSRSSPTLITTSTLVVWSSVTASAPATGNNPHVIATSTTGAMYAWGRVTEGQMGTPVSFVSMIPMTGGQLALRSDNTLWGWGRNNYLGFGTTVGNRSSPSQVLGGVRAMNPTALGWIATTLDGNIWGCGAIMPGVFYGDNGATARPASMDFSSPIQVKASQGEWYNAWMSQDTVYAIKNNGTLWAWSAYGGTLGNNTTIARSSPVQVGSATDWISGVRQITVMPQYYGLYYLKNDDTLWNLGAGFGAVSYGFNTSVSRSSPSQITGAWKHISEYNSASTSISFIYGVKTDGTLWFWGNEQTDTGGARPGLNGLNTTVVVGRSSPTQITAVSYAWVRAPSLAPPQAGYVAAIGGVTANGAQWGWGFNQNRNIKFGQSGPQNPVGYPIWCSGNSAIFSNGALYMWGSNAAGLFGTGSTNGTVLRRSSPVQAGTGMADAVRSYRYTRTYSRDPNFMIANQDDDTLWSWGQGWQGQLGQNTTLSRSAPTQITGSWVMASAVRHAASPDYTSVHALKNDGLVYTWGDNRFGQLGDNTTQSKSNPTQISASMSFVTVGGGATAGIAVATDGTLWTWGDNTYGALGDGTTISKSSPTQIGSRTDWGTWLGAVTTNGIATWAIDDSGRLYGWGGSTTYNISIGDSSTVSRSSPVQIGSATDWWQISAGTRHAGGVRRTHDAGATSAYWGGLYMWGNNTDGQLATGDTLHRSSPVQIQAGNISTRAIYWVSCNVNSTSAAYYQKINSIAQWGSFAVFSGATAPYTMQDAPGTNTTISRSSPAALTWNPALVTAALGGDNYYSQPVQVQIDYQPFVSKYGFNVFNSLQNRSFYFQLAPSSAGGLNYLTTTGIYTAGVNSTNTNGFSVPNNTATATAWSSPIQVGTVSGAFPPQDFYSPVRVNTNTWSKIAAGGYSSYGIDTAGKLWAWGQGTSGQLGLGTAVNYSSPTQIGSATDWGNVKAGFDSAMAINTGNVAYTWGNNASSQLGDNSTINKSSPTQIGTTIITGDMGRVNGGYIQA